MLRIDPEKHTWLKVKAAKNRRSLNAEINLLIDKSYDEEVINNKEK
jgi:predicted HicB family RNase H-like nuclease